MYWAVAGGAVTVIAAAMSQGARARFQIIEVTP
jgi:hypothetical protein